MSALKILLGVVLILPTVLPVVATAVEALQQPPSVVAPKSAAAATPQAAAGDAVRFAQLPARIGDRVAQSVGVELQLHTTITQAGQQASDNRAEIKRRQQRFVEVLELSDGGNVRRAHVTYPLSRMTAAEGDESGGVEEVTQPVEKHSYFVTRDGKQLLVTDTDGAIPPQAEYEIVAGSLQNLGLPNPLIKFLLGRTVRVGEKLQLPQAIAEEVMGLGDQFSKVEEFELELKSIEAVDGHRCAVFAAKVAAVGDASSPVRIQAFGKVVIQEQSCRVVRAELSGPLSLSTVEQTARGDFQYSARGNMRVAVEAQYGRATRK